MNPVGIVSNVHSPMAADAIGKLAGWLGSRGLDYVVEKESAKAAGLRSDLDRAHVARTAGLIVVLGGDGTIISVARLVEGRATPILGVNLGSLGFLTEFSVDEMIPALERVLDGDYHYDDRIMLNATVYYDGQMGGTYAALNDIVVHRGALSQMIDIGVEVDGVFVNNYVADGLIVSTPTGSTAYNLSSGGPIVYPSLNAIIINPICPHALSNRPIVIPDNVEVTLSLSPKVRGEAVATLDGQVGLGMNARNVLKIVRSREVTRIIQSPFKNYYELLRGKLKWGGTIQDESG